MRNLQYTQIRSMCSVPFKWQCRNVVLWLGHQEDAGDVMCLYFRPSQLMAAPHTVIDCLDFFFGQFAVAACYRIRKYFDINPITILLFLHCIFLSLKAHIFNFVLYNCSVFNFFLHRLSSKGITTTRGQQGCFILNKLSEKINTAVDWTLKRGSHWRGTATFLEVAWRQRCG